VSHSLEKLIDRSASVIFLCRKEDYTVNSSPSATTILHKAQENHSVFVIQKEKSHWSSPLRTTGFVRLRWPSYKSNSIVCIRMLQKLRRDEFYFKLRRGLPKPTTDSSSLENASETNLTSDIRS
jgi:hypothetical protein